MRVVTVLKSGGDFKPLHVQALQRQVAKWAPSVAFECLTDMDVPGVDCEPLARPEWAGWWAKMNLFDPAYHGDFLYMDLDTVIVGPLDDLARVEKLTLLRDFYRDGKKLKEGLQSSVMFLPEREREAVWDDFTANPALSMMLHRYGGDQKLLEMFYLNRAARWQDVLPGQFVSWKVSCSAGVPPEARVVVFHGQPRPWAVGQFLHLYR
jgi:hypothetical protein